MSKCRQNDPFLSIDRKISNGILPEDEDHETTASVVGSIAALEPSPPVKEIKIVFKPFYWGKYLTQQINLTVVRKYQPVYDLYSF